jgi:hypothetical protein
MPGAASSLFHCDNHLAFCTGSQATDWEVRGLVVAVVLPIPSQFSKDNITPFPMTLSPPNFSFDEDISSYQIGFCPMSGRLVYPSPGGVELRLAEYLLPPGEPHQE